jgi:hypothetical protein
VGLRTYSKLGATSSVNNYAFASGSKPYYRGTQLYKSPVELTYYYTFCGSDNGYRSKRKCRAYVEDIAHVLEEEVISYPVRGHTYEWEGNKEVTMLGCCEQEALCFLNDLTV